MPQRLDDQLVIAISSRTLFDLEHSHQVFKSKGVEAYSAYQVEHENDVLEPGVAFPLVRKLLRLNEGREQPLVEVILLSRNSADTGLRVFNSIEHHGLGITRAAFTNGEAPWRYISAFGADLFLSAHSSDVAAALKAGCAAAHLVTTAVEEAEISDQIRIAFDGDAVLFSDEAERIYREQGLEAFRKAEKTSAKRPLSGGPFHGFLTALHRIQQSFPAENPPIRTALVTARDAPAHERVIRTLRKAVVGGQLAEPDAHAAFGALMAAEITYTGTTDTLLQAVWGMRHNVSAYDAAYLAVAAERGAQLVTFDARLRIDTPGEATYYRHGGILQYVLRQLLTGRERPEAIPAPVLAGPQPEREILADDEDVDEGSLESFPASDPPAY
jgi:5'-nucleotidase